MNGCVDIGCSARQGKKPWTSWDGASEVIIVSVRSLRWEFFQREPPFFLPIPRKLISLLP